MLPRQLKWAKQRITKGYCRSDWYDMDSWFAHVVADMFDEYAENTCSHPWEINNPDDWKDILKEMATHLRNAGIEEIPAKDMKLEDLKDVKISESGVEDKDILMYNKENEVWENKNMDKYLEDNLVDGGGVPQV